MGTNLDVANTIIQQIGRSTRNLSAAIGAHTFTAGEQSLTFKFKARAKNGANCARITLLPSDTYKVELLSIRGTSVKTKYEIEGAYAEDLKPIFERETGLYLSLF